MELLDVPMRLKYMWNSVVIDAGPTHFEEEWYDDWLDGMVETDPDIIFFLVTESTDVFEKEWDFNEIAVAPEVISADEWRERYGRGMRGQG